MLKKNKNIFRYPNVIGNKGYVCFLQYFYLNSKQVCQQNNISFMYLVCICSRQLTVKHFSCLQIQCHKFSLEKNTKLKRSQLLYY